MNYVEELAREVYSAAHPGRELPEEQARLYRLYGLLVLIAGQDVSSAHVHDAWVAWATEVMPDHRSLRPFAELSAEVREKDRRYVEAIRSVAARRESTARPS